MELQVKVVLHLVLVMVDLVYRLMVLITLEVEVQDKIQVKALVVQVLAVVVKDKTLIFTLHHVTEMLTPEVVVVVELILHQVCRGQLEVDKVVLGL